MLEPSLFLRVVTLIALLGAPLGSFSDALSGIPSDVSIPASTSSPVSWQTDSVDSVAPSTISNLSAETGTSPGSVELKWIAPGDDYSTGTAAAYIVRYNTVPIVVDEDENTWITSIDVAGEPLPKPAGSLESMTVTGLELGHKYYFAIKSEDEMSNISDLSNLAQATALNPNPIYLPITLGGYTHTVTDTVVIPDTTVVVPITTTQYLEKLSGDYTFTFSKWTPELEALDPGDVMVGDVSANAPNGFLRKVKTVGELCDKVVVTTELATLEEAIQTASVRTSQTLTPDQVVFAQHADGVTMAASPDGLGFEFTMEDMVLYDKDKDFRTDGDQILLDGGFSLDLGVDIGIDISWFELRQFRFIVNAVETTENTVEWKLPYTISHSIPVNLSYLKMAPFTIMAGPVPVVIQPEIGLVIDFEGNVSVAVTAGVVQVATARLGAIYENGQWSGVHEFNNTFTWHWPWEDIQVSAGIKVAFNPKLTLKLYGVAGPYVGVVPFMELEAVLTLPEDQRAGPPFRPKEAALPPVSPDALEISLYAGIGLKTGAQADILGRKLANYEGPTLTFKFRLLHYTFWDNREPNPPSNPIPADNATGLPLNPLLLWTGGDPDEGDGVTYQLYLEANESYPDVLVYTGTDAFHDPGTLSPNTTYYWRVVTTDGDSATSFGMIWSFTTGSLANNPPLTPGLPSPGDGLTNTLIYLDLRWSGGDSDGDGVTYDVFLDTANPPVKLLAGDITQTNAYTGGLQTSTPYFWKVVAQDEHGRTASGPVWSFTTGNSTNQPPRMQDLNIAPGDGEGNIPLLWSVAWWFIDMNPDPDYDPVTYTVYLEADDITPDVAVCVDQPYIEYNTCDPGVLQGNTSYYWQVVARDDEGATTTGPVWMFATADMVYVPAGEFQMGCDACNPDETCSPDEQPLHTVYLDEFTINRTEVTNLGYTGCYEKRCFYPWQEYSRTRPNYYSNPRYAEYPVIYVDYEGANTFCHLMRRYGKLPTEAQWEKAARAAFSAPKFPWGNTTPDCSLANFSPDGGSACVGDTSQVGSYPLGVSPYGVMDLSGNVKEWVRDVYSSTYYSNSPYSNPLGPPEGDTFVVRGGSWEDDDYGMRLAHREFAYMGENNDTLGFRCVWEPSKVPGASISSEAP